MLAPTPSRPARTFKRSKFVQSRVVRRKRVSGYRVPRLTLSNTAGFPARLRTKLRYVQVGTLALPASNAGVTQQFSLNSLFDPTVSGAASRHPMYWDQLSVVYNKYTVHNCYWKLTLTGAGSATPPVVFGVYYEDNTTITPAAMVQIMEQPTAVYKITSNGFGSGLCPTIRGAWSASKEFGHPVIGNDDIGALITASPVTQKFLTVFANGSPQAGTVTQSFYIELVYDTEWENRTAIQQT